MDRMCADASKRGEQSSRLLTKETHAKTTEDVDSECQ